MPPAPLGWLVLCHGVSGRFSVYYGMADARMGVARLTLSAVLPPAGGALGTLLGRCPAMIAPWPRHAPDELAFMIFDALCRVSTDFVGAERRAAWASVPLTAV
jgi:hypothetical protein